MKWGDEQNASLLRMKEAGKTLSEIADVFGCSVKAVHEAHLRLRAKTLVAAGGTVGRKGERWTIDENASLLAAGDKGEEFGAIGVRLGRTRWACKVQYCALKRGQGRSAAKISNQRVTRQSATALAKDIRETRPQHASITAEFFGDPLPGRSALDQRSRETSGITLATGPMR